MLKYISLVLFLSTSTLLAQNKQITLEDIWKTYTFYPKSVKGFNSMNNGEHFTRIESNDDLTTIGKYAFKSGKKIKTILSSNDIDIDISNYTFSSDENKILFKTETEKIYRYSSKSMFYIYDLRTKKIDTLFNEKVMYATFSPDGYKVAFAFDNNLYVKDLTTNTIRKITTDGRKNSTINGVSDWVYEEEFGLVQSFFWSPDGKKIAFYKFDENEVKEFSMDMFNNKLYPQQYHFKYPKAGEKNSKVSIHIADIENNKITKLLTNKNYEYFPRMNWTKDNDMLYIIGMNRHQNSLDFILYNASSNSSRILFTESDKYYLDIHDNISFSDNNDYMIWSSEKSGFNHLYTINLSEGKWEQITNGNWEVNKFHGVNFETQTLFYSSNEISHLDENLFSISLDGSNKTMLTREKGTNSCSFSKGMKYFINNFSTANTPPFYSIHKSNGNLIRVLENNESLAKKMKEYNLSEKEFFDFNTSDGTELSGWMIKPTSFDSTKKYPVLMYLYGGPGSKEVKNSWGWFNYFWHQLLVQKDYIVVCVDNRGTGGKGSEFKKMTYKELGKYETIDQIESNKFLRTLPYVDGNRIGIQGWSYGGYLSSLAITKGAEYFNLAIAVAPVTNWRYYDNIYTERFMRTPQENPTGYDENSPINHVDSLKGKYLLIHGTADDNVHVQNTYEMVSALVKANKQFDLFVYPDKNHGIYGGNTRLHLYKLMTDYILDNL
ncbi:MAG: S9 family peptidase [Flavobacteriales bacterium]